MLVVDRYKREFRAKVVLLGSSGTEEETLLKICSRNSQSDGVTETHIGGCRLLQTNLFFPDVNAQGWGLRTDLLTTSGEPTFRAIYDLLLSNADGVIFLFDVSPYQTKEKLEEIRFFFHSINEQKDPPHPISILQGHRCELQPEFTPERVTQFLNIPPNSIPQYNTSSAEVDPDPCIAIGEMISLLIKQISTEALG